MTYADLDFWLALAKPSDWLKERAESLYREYEGELEASPYLFMELCYVAEQYEFGLHDAAVAVLAATDADDETKTIVLQAIEYIEEGVTVADAFHAAATYHDDRRIISSDQIYDELPVERVPLEG